MKEAFQHLKGWYWDASATTSRPCYQTLERQMANREALYMADPPEGDNITINVEPYDTWD